MDLSSIDIAAYSTEKALVDAQNEAGVKVIKGQKSQLEAIAQILFSSIEATAPRAPEQTGQRLNIQA
jgi:hypothetical protein